MSIKSSEYVHDKCRECGQNIPKTGRYVQWYTGYAPLDNLEHEKKYYRSDTFWHRLEDRVFESGWMPSAERGETRGNITFCAVLIAITIFGVWAIATT